MRCSRRRTSITRIAIATIVDNAQSSMIGCSRPSPSPGEGSGTVLGHITQRHASVENIIDPSAIVVNARVFTACFSLTSITNHLTKYRRVALPNFSKTCHGPLL